MTDTRFSDHLHDLAAPIWQAQHDHPFVRGIGDGTLDNSPTVGRGLQTPTSAAAGKSPANGPTERHVPPVIPTKRSVCSCHPDRAQRAEGSVADTHPPKHHASDTPQKKAPNEDVGTLTPRI